jgi:predicted transcriptional regulator
MLHEKALLEAALRHEAFRSPASPPDMASARAGDLATHDFCVVDPSTDVAVVSDLLRRFRIALVMDDKEKLAGVLTRIDLIDHLARRAANGTTP